MAKMATVQRMRREIEITRQLGQAEAGDDE
jgi:hypothetical protein